MVNAGLRQACRGHEAARADALRGQIRPISTMAALISTSVASPKFKEVVLVRAIHELLR
jgi:hypothetical protein